MSERFDFNNNKLNCRKRYAAAPCPHRPALTIRGAWNNRAEATVALSVGRTRAPGHMVWPTNWIPSGGPRDSVIPHRVRHSLGPVANRTSRRLLEGKKKWSDTELTTEDRRPFLESKNTTCVTFRRPHDFFACSTSICLTKIRGCCSRVNRIKNRFRGEKKKIYLKISIKIVEKSPRSGYTAVVDPAVSAVLPGPPKPWRRRLYLKILNLRCCNLF